MGIIFDKLLNKLRVKDTINTNNITTQSETIVLIQKPEDFGVIDSSKIYIIDKVVDMGSTEIEVPSGGINITGYDFDVSKLISSADNYTMFKSIAGGSGNILGMDYGVEVTGNNSKVYDLYSATGFDAFEFARINYNDCSSLGVISDYRQGLETGTGRFGGKPTLTLSGSWLGGYFIDTSIVRSMDSDMTTPLYMAGSNFMMQSRFRSNQNIDLPVSASFFDFVSGSFPNPSTVQLDGCLITRNGVSDATDPNLIPNMNNGDLPAKWIGNEGIPNTFVGGRLTITTEITTPIAATSTFYDVSGEWDTTVLQHFDEPVNGALRHLGNNPREYSIVGSLALDSGTNDEIALQIVKFDSSEGTTMIEASSVRQVNNFVGSRDVAFFTIIDDITLDRNDYVYLQVANNSSTTNITVELDSYIAVREK